MEIKIMRNILDSNNKVAEENRSYFKEKGICSINIMASPGAGKTSVILKIIEALRNNADISVIEGDIASSIDSEKIAALGIPVVQINTGGGCHLDANMIKAVTSDMQIKNNSLLLIENVGNLVCPSAFDLGEALKLVIASVPEGHDKPFKYISMYESADIIILNKIDLVSYFDFDIDYFIKGIKAINQKAPIFNVSCKTGQGIEGFIKWILKFN